MTSIRLQRVKTEDIIQNRLNKQKIEFPIYNNSREVRKASFSYPISKSSEGSLDKSNLIRISSHSNASTKPMKSCAFDSSSNSCIQSPKKTSIKLKNVEFPPLGVNQERGLSSVSPKTSCKNRRQTEKLTRVIKDCQKLVKIVENIKLNSEVTPPKSIEKVNVKNIFIPPQPHTNLSLINTEEERLAELKKQLSVIHIQAKKFNLREKFFTVKSPTKGSK